jgi:hypothetical protein
MAIVNDIKFGATAIWKELWLLILPLIVTAIVSPYTKLFNYPGIIVKEPALINDTVEYEFLNNSTAAIAKFRAHYTIADSLAYALADLPYLDEYPSNPDLRNQLNEIGQPDASIDAEIEYAMLPAGLLKLMVPLQPVNPRRQLTPRNIGTVTWFRIEGDNEQIRVPLATRPYHIYDYRYFHPFTFSLCTLIVLVIVTLAIRFTARLKKPNKKTKTEKS